jgi:YD repeat-containing protein
MSGLSLELLRRLTRRMERYGAPLLILFCLFAPSIVAADSAQYFYDPAGRLTGVLDPVNGSARYSYDKSGNISSIVRSSLATPTVLQASPGAAAIGGTVTIAGTAFGTTANTSVSFNGTSATPSVVTSTSLTVIVPSGATTGTLSVTAPSGTAAWSSPFTVLTAAAPTISSFTTGTGTPTTANPGDSLTISGTNFDTAKSKVFVNGQFARITSATTTSLVVVVPPSSSGKVQVQTPAGGATSSSDLAITTQTFTPANIFGVTRTTIGASAVTVTAGASTKASLVLFDATAGQRVEVHVVLSGLPGCAKIWLLNTSGIAVSTTTVACGTNYWTGPIILSPAGTYSIALSSYSGSGSFTLKAFSVPADATAALTSGTTSNLTLTVPGQRAVYTFSGTSGNKISVQLRYNSLTPDCDFYSIVNPDTTIRTSGYNCDGFFVISPFTLSQTGKYTIIVRTNLGGGSSDGTGTVSGTYWLVPADATAALTSGTTSNLSLTVPGQRAVYTFSGASGNKVSVLLRLNSLAPDCDFYSIVNPDTSIAASGYGCDGFFVTSPFTLSQTGTYAIIVTTNLGGGASDGTGTVSGTYWLVPADATAALTSGTASNLSLTVPGQRAAYTFSGTSGDKISVRLRLNSLIPDCDNYAIINPDTTQLTSGFNCDEFFVSSPFTLGQTGTYTIVVTPSLHSGSTDGTGTVIGTYWLVPADATAVLTIGGGTGTLSITAPGQQGHFTFSGTASTSVTINVNAAGMTNCASFSVLNPDTSTLFGSTFTCGAYSTGSLPLSQTGTYTIRVVPNQLDTGTTTGSVN